MDSLEGQKLVKADGSSVAADQALADKELVLYYFSAHWCPPCKQFTPMLKDFYEEVGDDEKVEIVFVSSDRSPAEMISYMKESHGDWYATEHGSQLTNDLKQKYGIRGIPTLIVCKKDGTVVTNEGRAAVMSSPPAQAVKTWKS
eukprot:TRINITY_DN24148_c0_g1_i1.p1 TRINITY_DN24148_c0_g1~~TRINITY_DN24148_c0_g1_i1.p1  ORF type:complete len:158 (-),score=55.96 TRINITY_DN24148_c0_g1_i1:299-730(-)